jgi:hypothetical protein
VECGDLDAPNPSTFWYLPGPAVAGKIGPQALDSCLGSEMLNDEVVTSAFPAYLRKYLLYHSNMTWFRLFLFFMVFHGNISKN